MVICHNAPALFLFVFLNILHNILNIAVKNSAKHFYRVCTYTFIPL